MRFALLLFVVACGSKSAPPAEPAPVAGEPAPTPVQPPGGDCVKSGCSSTMCVEAGKEMMTTCEWKAEYACYQQAACTRQPDGQCGWTQSDDLKKCLASPPASP